MVEADKEKYVSILQLENARVEHHAALVTKHQGNFNMQRCGESFAQAQTSRETVARSKSGSGKRYARGDCQRRQRW